MVLTAAHTGKGPVSLLVFWKRLEGDKREKYWNLSLQLNADGQFHTYHLELKSSPEYRGLITGLAIEPSGSPQSGEEMAIQSIELKK